MPHFDVYVSPYPAMRALTPFLVDVQSDLIDALPTRLVMPLPRLGATQMPLPRNLCPAVKVEGESLVLMPHLAAPVAKRLLRRPVLSIAHCAR